MSAPQVMGIINVTPDSFSDGGDTPDTPSAVAHGRRLAEEGAAILDVGGESTRPGSEGVPEDAERSRVIPVIEALCRLGHTVSIDTRKAAVMDAATAAGAVMINDVSALSFEAGSRATAARLQRPTILMHARGDPKTMQVNPTYDDVVLDVFDFLADAIERAVAAGLPRSLLLADPGIGFGKTFRHNLEILASARRLSRARRADRRRCVAQGVHRRDLGRQNGQGQAAGIARGGRLGGRAGGTNLACPRRS